MDLGRLFRELRRRKVFQVAVVYAVVAWGVIEVADTIFPRLDLPPWLVTAVVVFALLGFPIALVLAWAFDVTPEGVKRTRGQSAKRNDAARNVPGANRNEEIDEPDPRARVIAVLPFENLSGTSEAEPFTAGLHDDLLTELSRVSALTVISRTSVMGYQDTKKTIPEIGRELGVGTVVEGAVQHAGGRVRLNVQLIDARGGGCRWAERYDRDLTAENIFDLQSELAERITNTLRAELSPEEKARVRRTPTESLDAYRLYARGRTHLDQRTEDGVHGALDCFQRAIQQDPSYGLAWAGLAEALGLIEWYDYECPSDAPDLMYAARRAVELTPESGEAYTSLGVIHALRYEGSSALKAFQRALELKPSDAETSTWLAWLHLILGQPQKALAPAMRAAELDPRAPAVRVFLAETHLANGEPRNALLEAARARQLQPQYGIAHFMEGLALYHLGRFGEARSVLDKALPLVRPQGTPSRSEVQALLALTHVAAGEPAEARTLLDRVQEAGDAFSIGLIHAALGRRDEAFRAFQSVKEWDTFSNEHLRYFFPDVLGPLRRDPRYDRLLQQVDRSWGLASDGEELAS